jgi:O-antigen/teichoic acid export membrane protein
MAPAADTPPRLARKVALNASALTAGRVCVLAAGVVTIGLSSRYLGVSGFGSLTIATVFVALFAGLTDFGLYTIAAREMAKTPERESRIVSNAFTLGVLVALAAAAVCFGLSQLIYRGRPLVHEGIAILLIELLCIVPIATARAYYVAHQRAYVSGLGDILAGVVQLALVAAAVAADWGFLGIIGAQAAAFVANAALMMLLTARRMRLGVAFDRGEWGRLIRWSAPLGGTQVVNDLYFRLDTILLSFFRPSADVGVYGLAYKVVEALIILPSYVMVTLIPEIARTGEGDPRLRRILDQALSVMETVAVPLALVFIVFAPEVVRIIGGPRFHRADVVLQILVAGVAVSYLNAVFGNAAIALNRQAALFKLSVAVLTANLALNLILIPTTGIYGAASAVTASELLALLVLRRMFARLGYLPHNPKLARLILAGAAMAVPMLLFATIPDLAPALILSLGAACGIAVYGASLIGLHALPAGLELPRRRRSTT